MSGEYVVPFDERSRGEVLRGSRYFSVGLQAERFVTSRKFRWIRGGEATISLFSLDYMPTPDQLTLVLHERGLVHPHESHALRFGERYPKAFKEKPILFYHADNVWKPSGQSSVLMLDYLRETYPRLRCPLLTDRLAGDLLFAGSVP